MSNEVLDDDIVRDFEDDVVELTTIEEDNSVSVEKEKECHKRRRTSAV
jgi:hypothetical protein